MKVLFFVDTHGSLGRIHKLKEKAKDAELLVCAGDFTIFENDMSLILKEFDSIGKPLLMINGNHETSSGVMVACEGLRNIHFIHRKYYIHGGIVFYGFGGGGFSIRDESFTRESELFIAGLDQTAIKEGGRHKVVLITHAPPYGTRLDDLGGHVGNKSIADFIHRHRPILAVSGHLHENAGVTDKLGDTRLINPGPDGMLIEL